ncbi:MAG: hypothetical protein ACXVXK_19865, partial [Blastococcus sp.]
LVAGFGQGLVMSPLFGLVLSQVPVDLAGVGSGVMSTTQQTALAVGATAIGTLFLTLARADDAGRAAFLVVLAIQGAVAVGGAALSRLLPQHGRA